MVRSYVGNKRLTHLLVYKLRECFDLATKPWYFNEYFSLTGAPNEDIVQNHLT